VLEGRDLFILMGEGSLLALDARTGTTRWRKNIVSEYRAVKPYYGFAGSPMVDGGLVILNANTAGMAVKRDTGELVWTSEAPPADELQWKIGDDNGATYMTPMLCAFGGKRCALIYGWKGLSAVQTETGTVLWTYEWQNYNKSMTPDPVVVGDRILIADKSRAGLFDRCSTLIRIEDGKPEVVWESSDLFCDTDTPLILDGHLYASYGGPYSISPRPPTLRCLEIETGRLVWEEHLAERRNEWLSLTMAGGRLIALTDNGILHTAEASPGGYREIARGDVLLGADKPRLFCTPPVLCNARIYCRNYGGHLICIDVKK
jgi:outer membrane protein assembly factor BamB